MRPCRDFVRDQRTVFKDNGTALFQLS